MHGNDERAKTQSQRASSDDAFRQRARSSFFFMLCAQAYVNIHFFLIFFYAPCLRRAAENKRKARPLSLSHSYIYIYIYIYIYATKVITRFFFLYENSDKPDRKSLQQVKARKKKKTKKKRRRRRN